MILSPRSRNEQGGYAVCSCCYGSMRPSHTHNINSLPNFALASGFMTGCFFDKIHYVTKDGQKRVLVATDEEISDLL